MKKLTHKEKIFVGEMIKTKGNRTESALRAYDTKRRENAKQIGMRVAKRPHIKEALEEAFNKVGINQDWLLEQEKEIIVKGLKHGKYTVSDARLSIQNLHKLYGSYPEKVNKNMNLNITKDLSNENTSEIINKLEQLTKTTQDLIKDINS